MSESLSPGDQYKNWKAPVTSEQTSEASGEIGHDKLLSLEETAQRMKANLDAEIEHKLDGRPSFSTAEVDNLLQELNKITRELNIGGKAIKELGAKDSIDYHATGEVIKIPTNLGEEKVYSLHIYMNKDLKRPQFRLEAVN